LNKNILKTGVQEFIEKKWNTDTLTVLLQKPQFAQVTQKELVVQLEAKKRCHKKLPTWFNTPKVYYPAKLNIEQTSSEKTALYKSELVSGKQLLDMTGGLGLTPTIFPKRLKGSFIVKWIWNFQKSLPIILNCWGQRPLQVFQKMDLIS